MADLSPIDRLVRKRNSNLQKQLDVTLQILNEEYRQTKERMYKEERDCGKFLQSLYNTVPGLNNYEQPDTRAMNSNALLKERRHSMPAANGSDCESTDHVNSRTTSNLRSLAKPRPSSGRPNSRSGNPFASDAQSISKNQRNSSAKGHRGNSAKGPRDGSSQGQRGGSANSRAGMGHQNASRPSTASNQTHKDIYSSEHLRRSRRRNSQKYGKSAYTDHERFVQDKVIKKFVNIFDPETEARKVNLNPRVTPIVVVEPEHNSNNSHINNIRDSPHHNSLGNGKREDLHGSRNTVTSRRVMSAHPHRKQKVTSAPFSARTERHKPETAACVHTVSVTSASRPKSVPQRIPGQSAHNSDQLDSRIKTLAHQRNLPIKYTNHSDSSSESDMGEEPSTIYQPDKEERVEHHIRSIAVTPDFKRKRVVGVHQTQPHSQASVKIPPQYTHKHGPAPSHNLLQVPGTQQHPPQHPDSKPSDTHAPQHTMPRRNSIQRPSSRLSDVSSSDVNPPVELWSKLMKAGLPGKSSKRPKTAPSKSELTHRYMPAPRQTVAGILAQIENQKASTRAMINASKGLQNSVKKMVPLETRKYYDTDDW